MSIVRRIANVFRSERLSSDIRREMEFHLREHADALVAGGLSEREAMAQARRRFGNPTALAERTRDVDLIGWLDSVRGDVRYAVRALAHAPAFALIAIASLAIGIGANTAIYSILDAVVLRALPVPAPEELVHVTLSDADQSGYFTNPLWEQVRDRQTSMTGVAAFGETSWNLAEGGEVRRVAGSYVSGDYFAVFGMRPHVGRLLTRADDVRGCPAVAVLGHGFWESEFGADPSIVGRTISLDGTRTEIVGVTARGFTTPVVGQTTRLYLPLCAEALVEGERSTLDARSTWWMQAIGRRAPDVPLAQVRANLKAVAPAVYAATVPTDWAVDGQREYLGRTLSVRAVASGLSYVRERYTTSLTLLMGAVALVLLIACANVANLLFARAAARQREVAVRLAMGAARARLVRQLLTESALLAVAGAAGGLLVAHWGARAIVALISTPNDPVSLDLALDARVLAFTALVATVTAVLFGLAPAWRGTRVSPQTAMKAHARGVVGGGGYLVGRALVAAQIALSLTLLVGAGLLVRSVRNLATMDPGFRAEGVLLARVGLARAELEPAQRTVMRQSLVARARALPGVGAASTANIAPMSGAAWNDEVHVEGHAPASRDERVAWFNEVGDGYFATMETALLAGRDFGPTDVPGGERVAIVNADAARRFFGDASPIGRTFRLKRGDAFEPPITIVGVVRTSQYRSLRESSNAIVYLAMSQADPSPRSFTLMVRTSGDPAALVPGTKAAIAAAHPRATVEFSTLESLVRASVRRDRTLALLAGVFGAVALGLSMLGLFGVMAYTVARRRNEIGIRIALGAARGRVVGMVLGDVVRMVVVGGAIGVGGALAAGSLVASFLFGVEPGDVRVMASAAGILALTALVAGLVPALRAAHVDPVEALRAE